MIRRLRIQFVCAIMAVTAALLCVLFGTVLHFTRAGLEAESLRAMRAAALEPPGLVRPGQRPGEARLPCFTLQLGPRGELIVSGDGYYDLTEEALLREILSEVLAAGTETGVLDAHGLRFLRTGPPDRPAVVCADLTGEQRTMERLVRTCLLAGLGVLLAFLAVSILLSRWMVRPVDEAWRRQRQFVADASHELKTPLTVIQTNAELLEGGDPAAQARYRENILAMARQMRTLVEGLLELARADSGIAERAAETVDFSKLVQDALLPFEPVFFERGLVLKSAVEPGLLVRGSPEKLCRAVDILLDNARKYTAPAGTVRVTLVRQGRYGTLSVSGPGKELSPQECRDVFKRFYRADPARTGDGGYGLGLAIAKEITAAHGGKIRAESGGGRNTFFIRLPLCRGGGGGNPTAAVRRRPGQ